MQCTLTVAYSADWPITSGDSIFHGKPVAMFAKLDASHVEELLWIGRDVRAWDGSVPAALQTAVMRLVLARVQWTSHFANLSEAQLRKAYDILTASPRGPETWYLCCRTLELAHPSGNSGICYHLGDPSVPSARK
eukprot:668978-Amphidinium_carterae.1